jgi:uncharacterized protein YegP (UPF0339 family)
MHPPSEKEAVMAKFQVYADAAGKYCWRFLDDNGKNVASSGESFAGRSNAKRAAENVKTTAASASVGS